MDKNTLIELTNKLYRLTLLFPKKEPLRYKIREAADEFLANFINFQVLNSPNPGGYAVNAKAGKNDMIFSLERDFEILDSFLEIAKWQNWTSYFDVLEIQEEYAKISKNLKEEIKKLGKNEAESFQQAQMIPVSAVLKEFPKRIEIPPKEEEMAEMASRKERIINVLKRIERIQVGEVNKLFPEVSKRTIRRDFQKMVKQGIIERLGERNNTFYRLKLSEAGPLTG